MSALRMREITAYVTFLLLLLLAEHVIGSLHNIGDVIEIALMYTIGWLVASFLMLLDQWWMTR